jgi:quinol monooxygenase YgiN
MFFYHIAFISFLPEVSEENRQGILDLDCALGKACGGQPAGILEWKVEENLDTRKGVHLVQFSVFRDKKAFDEFRMHPAHTKFVAKLQEVANWTVGDFESED